MIPAHNAEFKQQQQVVQLVQDLQQLAIQIRHASV